MISRQGLLRGIQSYSKSMHGILLDVGCGVKPYKELFSVSEYVGIDVDTGIHNSAGSVDFFYDGKNIPFPDSHFDCVLCSQVLEHVFHPDELLVEIFRVLKPGGKILLTVPFVWDEHEQPYDFARYSSFGLTHLFLKAGFEIESVSKSSANIGTIFQMFNAYIFKITAKSNIFVKIASSLFLVAPFNFLGIVLGKILPNNPDFYLDNILFARKP